MRNETEKAAASFFVGSGKTCINDFSRFVHGHGSKFYKRTQSGEKATFIFPSVMPEKLYPVELRAAPGYAVLLPVGRAGAK